MSRDANVQVGTEQGQITYIYIVSRSHWTVGPAIPRADCDGPPSPAGTRNGCGANLRK